MSLQSESKSRNNHPQQCLFPTQISTLMGAGLLWSGQGLLIEELHLVPVPFCSLPLLPLFVVAWAFLWGHPVMEAGWAFYQTAAFALPPRPFNLFAGAAGQLSPAQSWLPKLLSKCYSNPHHFCTGFLSAIKASGRCKCKASLSLGVVFYQIPVSEVIACHGLRVSSFVWTAAGRSCPSSC